MDDRNERIERAAIALAWAYGQRLHAENGFELAMKRLIVELGKDAKEKPEG